MTIPVHNFFKIDNNKKPKLELVSIARRKFLMEILYTNITIIAIQHSKMHFVDTFGDFSHTVE